MAETLLHSAKNLAFRSPRRPAINFFYLPSPNSLSQLCSRFHGGRAPTDLVPLEEG